MNRTFIPSSTRNAPIKKLPKMAGLTGMFLLFILPLVLLLYNELHEINKWVEFTQRERIGLEYNRSLRKLMEDLMHHRGMTNAYLSGDGSFTDSIETEHSEIKNDIRAIDSLNGRYGRLLKTDDKWQAFKESWQEREHTEYTLSPRESFDSHTALIADIMALMSHVGETSNLILDPQLAVTDPLTQIYNRLKFNNALEIEIARARRHKRVFSLLMFDIDHFKDINDSFGHEVGDETLKTLTNIVSRHVRVTDTFARWGGEEFVILVVETPAEGGGIFAEKLRKEIEETSFGIAGKVTCSFGVTQFKETDDITSITKRVDEALYEAKGSGRNRVCVR